MGFFDLFSFQSDEKRPLLLSYEIILEQREERNQLIY